MAKIKKITVSNLKAVSALTADFNGCTAIITGGNNKGKSSFLRSLPERLRGNKPDVILKHGESEGFAEWELTTGEKFLWSFDGKKDKLTFISERNIKAPITKDISTYYFPPVFDVDTFLNSTPAKQKAWLQKLTGIDFTEIDALYKEAYENRTWANKKLAEEKAKAQHIDPTLPAEVQPTEELEKEIAGLDAHNQRITDFKARMQEKAKMVTDNNTEICELQDKIKRIEEKNKLINEDIEKGKAWLADDKNKVKLNGPELTKQLADLKAKNKEIEANNENKKQQEVLNTCEQRAAELDAQVKRIEAEKLDVIKSASMPEGFGFSDDGITYNGFEFSKEQLSSSGIYIAALKLAALGLGEVKALHFDASFLDKNSLAEIGEWAANNDLQLLIERPDFEGGEIEYHIVNEAN